MDRNNPIWKTAECEAWSRSFSYPDYIQLAKHMNVSPVDPILYKGLCAAFEAAMEGDMAANPEPVNDEDFQS